MDQQRVLKSYSLREPGQKVVFDFEDFEQRVGDQLAETRQEADRYLNKARDAARLLLEQSRQEGFEAGYAAGMQKAAIEIQTKADAKAKVEIHHGLASAKKVLDSLAKAVANAKSEWLTRWEATAIELCAAMAEKDIHAELASRPGLSLKMVRELLELASSEERVIARVHPQDAEAMMPQASDAGGASHLGPHIEFRADATLNRGDCVVELEHGKWDGSIATQLARLTAELVAGEPTETGDV